jgi:transcriptional regulator with XRE-family HTH domain
MANVLPLLRTQLPNQMMRRRLLWPGGSAMKSKRTNAIDAAVGARIKNLRLRNKLSQTRLGEQVNVTFQQIQKYENGTNRVSAGRLAQLANFFVVPVAAFYSEVPATNGKPAKGKKPVSSLQDAGTVRLVKAFQVLKDKALKVAIMRLAEEMVRRQQLKSARRR